MAGEGLCSRLLLPCPLPRPQEPFVTRPPSVMRACCAVPKHRPRGQLPEGSSADQTMEYPLLSLKSILDTWLSFSSTSWGSAIVTGILCGLGLFLLSLHFHPSDLYSPPPRNITKRHLQPREKNRRWKRGAALRACRGRLREQEVASSLIPQVEW
ncbi:spermatogenesis-associated protein 31E1-like [Manis pentadactyla]|uniref:spermatogenesis-associated protein 31E1-like n=1 Tax=Manis pentadactyla TaxID=143292 RepID=UPI00255CF91F|nr:spermatogenesis-associated protein 31E1-like [Manis pentadactyla]